MKFVVLLLVVVGALAWLAISRRRPPADQARKTDGADAGKPPAAGVPQAMLACAHCGVHLPTADALRDAAGQVYCSDAHRLAGPRRAS